ncbi:UDP-N-acetylmuramoylalanine-D-glutamate ligase [Alloprevotella rava F0323]|uniref:UDP-N-acetylmuramoylalanine--D-glutamate ligase n=1 Tax=Alloprevotella rava F0323 TaxID=679199 RepID=G5GCD1_9BACT|nr:UDP-N-acetylmuramoyl-L-alanine--D-glutamate ligase [Alloprevotella rava]EHG22797.1 UDP-N-acetylmuramoylalanine-D-glutamate ligase [Alloprevotella rava F0323]
MRLVVLGAAESGVGAAVLAQKKGYDVFVSDMGTIKDSYKKLLDSYGLPWEEGHHTEALILNADEVVKSPGIPDTAPMVQQVKAAGIPVISEIEFAGRYTNAKTICITGSNGKTTTTSLIYHILQKAGYNVGLAGNIGKSFALQVAEGKHDWYVIELSSFQLDNMYDFRADIAVLLNITPDHLDRYDFKMQNYVNSKMRILQNQRPEDSFIYWAQDEWIPNELHKYNSPARMLEFSDMPKAEAVAYEENNLLKISQPLSFEMDVDELSLPGLHNLRNSMAGALATLSAGVAPEVVREGLSDFPGVEHRLEKVCDVDGVHYINDSKATNVDACYWALAAMRTPTVLIIGGKDKGNDYKEIAELVKTKCRALVYLGADNKKLHDFFDGFGLPVEDTHSMADCVKACARLAQKGDTVLLSPCCASFDLFRNMEDRGEQFKARVRELA